MLFNFTWELVGVLFNFLGNFSGCFLSFPGPWELLRMFLSFPGNWSGCFLISLGTSPDVFKFPW